MANLPKFENSRFERWLAPCVIICFCSVAFWISTTFREMPPILKRGIQPADFPQLLLITIILLTLAMMVFDPIKLRENFNATTAGSLGLFAVFGALTWIDLFLALGIFAAALAALWGERRPRILILVGAVMPLVIFLLFDQIFEIRFPRGLLTNLWYG
ncbi:MAG: tripartite tricarboxylate transporter TctB family protein [Marinovum sp.]|jgi:hypothetical protein|nr:hypothetical protein [Marinovum sp.]MDA9948906.1 tripartite tricarboxylate transporter TctB family protein [Paracoccaceae bacterium]MDC3389287.1 tripartite tricarboxylate transporter TctB family protein [bacterium]MBT4831616.1 tripartite tricarboxylate transporter TctB family protein [Marinovum sp.]MBT6526117.1 tripartite tricarboxylate transporter TctB family protein [Marinovum sp.]|tara:strand:+ start:329 stop:802 length:474 start_codon:yes stop_codon:yes gene_type:complete